MLTRVLCFSLFVVLPAMPVCAGDDSTSEKEILRLENALIEAWQKKDIKTVSSIVADDFQYWSFKGERRNKSDLLKLVERSDTSGDMDTHTQIEDPVVRIYGDTAVFTCRIIDTGKHADGKSFTGKTADTHVYIRRSDKWVLIAEQETLLQSIP